MLMVVSLLKFIPVPTFQQAKRTRRRKLHADRPLFSKLDPPRVTREYYVLLHPLTVRVAVARFVRPISALERDIFSLVSFY